MSQSNLKIAFSRAERAMLLVDDALHLLLLEELLKSCKGG
jgi:hypothetical protein